MDEQEMDELEIQALDAFEIENHVKLCIAFVDYNQRITDEIEVQELYWKFVLKVFTRGIDGYEFTFY